jgi:CheY-like chemotaxis protein
MAPTERHDARDTAIQTVAVVNGGPEMVLLLDAVVAPGAYRIEFVGLSRRTQSRIRALAPDLIVLCTRIDDPAGFQLLTMLKLDEATREIPVLTFTTECEGQDYIDSAARMTEEDELPYPPHTAELRMN